jgi:hypothetical protein
LVIVPSTMDSPIWGMTMSVGIISFHGPTVRNGGPATNEYYSGCSGGVDAQIQVAKRLIAQFVETRLNTEEHPRNCRCPD